MFTWSLNKKISREHTMGYAIKNISQRLDKAARELHEAVQQEESASVEAPAAPAKRPRAVETMFRTAYRVQMDLTSLADNKANMMISINGIIISIIIAAVAPKLDSNPWLLVPAAVFLFGTLVSIVYAILAARPRVSTAPITLQDLVHSEGNILFFGDFANLSKGDFLEGMRELIGSQEAVYDEMILNIYGLGSVLRKKFALLQVAYTAFMLALILGVSSFIGMFVWVMYRVT
jgi:hypothetical protein